MYRVQDLKYIGFKTVNSESKRVFPPKSGSLFVGPHGEDLVFWALSIFGSVIYGNYQILKPKGTPNPKS